MRELENELLQYKRMYAELARETWSSLDIVNT